MSAVDNLTFTPMDELVTLLAELPEPVRVAIEPQDVNLPGGWLALEDFSMANVAGQLVLRCSLYLIGPDTGNRRGLAHAAELYNRVTGAGVRPDGRVTVQGVVLPGDPTPMPALRVPIHLYTNGA